MSDRSDPNPAEDLSEGEALVLEALRTWAARRMAGACPHFSVRCLMECRASRCAAALFVGWMQAVEAAARRPIQIHCPRCGDTSGDERRLIDALGLATLDMDAGEATLAPLSADPGGIMVMSRALNAALASEGLAIPARLELSVLLSCADGTPTRH